MARATTVEDLERRQDLLKRATAIAAGLVLFAAAAFIFLLQPGAGTGPTDVHIPSGAVHLLDSLSDDRIFIAGGPIAQAQRWLSTFLLFVTIGSLGLFILALKQRRKGIAKIALPVWIGLSLLHPVSPAVQMNPPPAVTAATARSLLGIPPHGWPHSWASSFPENRYMLAQIAFVEGDRAAAARFAAGLDVDQLSSPIEGPFRLQFLQGRPQGHTTACLTSGCFNEPVRVGLLLIMLATILLGLASGGGSTWLRIAIGRRCARVAELRATGLSRNRVLG